MKITKETKQYLRAYNNQRIVNSQLAEVFGDVASWNNTDFSFSAELNLKTKDLTATFYEYDEDKDDWVDGEKMEDSELLTRLKDREFLLIEVNEFKSNLKY
jgi:hypothetical protein